MLEFFAGILVFSLVISLISLIGIIPYNRLHPKERLRFGKCLEYGVRTIFRFVLAVSFIWFFFWFVSATGKILLEVLNVY